jgi:hypothetical protein
VNLARAPEEAQRRSAQHAETPVTGAAAHDSATLMTVERGLEVLRAFRSDRTPLTNAELVRRTGLPKATVSRLTSTLLQVGFLRQAPGRRAFELADGALGIGVAFLGTNDLLHAAQPLLQDLADRLDVSVALAVPEGLDMLYVGYGVSRQVATLRLGVGSVLPMGSTSIGRAYLWALPPAQQRPLVAGAGHRDVVWRAGGRWHLRRVGRLPAPHLRRGVAGARGPRGAADGVELRQGRCRAGPAG